MGGSQPRRFQAAPFSESSLSASTAIMKRFQWLLANLLILIVVYSNAAIILNFSLAAVTPELSVPLPTVLDELFSLTGTKAPYGTTNHEIELYGITPSTPSRPRGEVVKLDAADYFPFSRSETLMRSWAYQLSTSQDEAGQTESYAALAAKIRARYNRLHPTAPVERIVIVQVEWERSLEGYETLKSNEDLTILYAD